MKFAAVCLWTNPLWYIAILYFLFVALFNDLRRLVFKPIKKKIK